MGIKTDSPAVLLADYGEQFKTYGAAVHRLGQVMVLPDGREFRFVKNGATLAVVGNLYQRAAPGADYDELAVAAAAIGDKTVTITLGSVAVTADQFAEGYINVEDDAGEGRVYKVTGNPAAAASATVVVSLAEPIQVAWTTSTTVGLYANPYDGVVIHPSPPTHACVGVAAAAIPASNWGWLQTRGPCSCLTDGTLVIGKMAIPSVNVNGAFGPPLLTEGTPNTGGDQPTLGIVAEVAADTEYSLIHLLIP